MDQTADRQRWLRIAPILDAVLELPLSGERSWIGPATATPRSGASSRNPGRSLAPDGFLDTPAIERAAPLILDIERDASSARPPTPCTAASSAATVC